MSIHYLKKKSSCLDRKIWYRTDIHNVNKRFNQSHQPISPPNHKTELLKGSFSYIFPKIVKDLPFHWLFEHMAIFDIGLYLLSLSFNY